MLKKDVGITLFEAPRSNMTFSNSISPMVHLMNKVHGSLHFWARARYWLKHCTPC